MELTETEREVDHYRPRVDFSTANRNIHWHQANQWLNLLYSCKTCNSRKSQKRPFINGQRVIIDPSVQAIDPEDHITFGSIGDCHFFYKKKNGSILGKNTIDKVKLNERKYLKRQFRKRRIEIEIIFTSLINAIEEGNVQQVQQFVAELRRAMSATVPFTAFNRYYTRLRLEELNNIDLPALNQMHGGIFQQIQIQFPTGFEQVL